MVTWWEEGGWKVTVKLFVLTAVSCVTRGNRDCYELEGLRDIFTLLGSEVTQLLVFFGLSTQIDNTVSEFLQE
jgi:hypothetical protein